MQERILCSGECNIRIDLLVIYPVLAVASLIGLGVAVAGCGPGFVDPVHDARRCAELPPRPVLEAGGR